MAEEELLTTPEIAEALGVKPGTISEWRKRHTDVPQPRRQVGKSYLYRLSDWVRWQNNRRTK